ncbi:MAG: hypothetical protein AAGH68_12435 [Pseudomonadota bacterium]
MKTEFQVFETDPRTYCEAAISAGKYASDVYQELQSKFGLSHFASKSLVTSSVSFNTKQSYRLWEKLKDTSLNQQQLTKRFMRNYKLSDLEARHLLDEFDAGNETALADIRSFDDLAQTLLTEGAQLELRKHQLLG